MTKHFRKVLLLPLFMLLNLIAFAQEIIVTGTVTNKDDGKPLEGVNVKIKNSSVGTATNKDGIFTIKAPSSQSILSFTYVGFDVYEVKAGSGSGLNIAMAKISTNLDDVVVVGYSTQTRKKITGAISTIKAAEIQDVPAPNIAGALRGRIAGLGVSAASGRPGASITLNVRNAAISEQAQLLGVTAEPLYVIDGITVGKLEFDNLDPSMVEDLTVLKDASAAIYGAAGAKGVILITTKKGRAGKPKLSYNGYVGHSDATRQPDMLSAYEHAIMLNDAYRINSAPANLFFSPTDLEYIKGLNYKSWFEELWSPSMMQRHNLSISGGSDKMTFFVGGGYQNENGNYAGIKQDKFTMRSGLSASITNSIKADINFSVDHNIRASKNTVTDNDQAFLESIMQMPRWVPVSIDDKFVNFNGTNVHPLGVVNSGYYRNSKTQGYRVNASLSYQPQGFLKGFTARFQVSQTASNGGTTTYRPNYRVYNFKRMGNNNQLYSSIPDTNSTTGRTYIDAVSSGNVLLEPSLNKSQSYQGFLTLQYNKNIGKHSMNVIVGGEQTESSNEDLGVRWTNQLLEGIDDYWAFDQSILTLGGRNLGNAVKRSYFGRFNYDFADKYLVDGVVRFDASSNFARGNIWGVFPSVGLGWVTSNEDFFKDNVSFMNYLKFRLSYGLTGDDRVSARLWQERFRVDPVGYMYNQSLQSGLNPDRIPNPEITWEKKRTLNFGMDMAFFRNKLNVTVEFFNNYIYDAFDKGNDQNFPMFAGFAAPVVNYQERYAWGSEFSIGYKAKIGRDWSVNTGINFGFSNSVIDQMFFNRFQLFENSPPDWQISMGTDPRKYNSGNFGLKNIGMFRTQQEVDAFMVKNPAYLIDGKVPQPGWLYFEDTNRDGKITERDMVPMFDRTSARFSTGIQVGVSYKSLSLSTNISARFGGKEFYDSKATERPEPTVNVPGFWRDRWTPENPSGKFPRFDDASIVRGWESTFWAVNATMIRVNNMTLSYRLPAQLLSKIGFSDARIMATGNNLWVLKNPLKYKDPYSSYIFDYPTIRTISVGLSFGF